MATVAFTISSPANGSPWGGTIVVPDANSQVKTTVPSSISVGDVSFTPLESRNFNLYYCFRTQKSDEQFPSNQTGIGLDIWSVPLITDISNNFTWTNLKNKGAYDLNPEKWTLLYNYDVPNAIYYSSGGTITFTIV